MKRLAVALAAVVLATGAGAAEQAAGARAKSGAMEKAGSMEMKSSGYGQATSKRVEKVRAKVTAVDTASRKISLQGPDGKTETFQVSKSVERLDEIQAGDDVVLAFEQGLILQHQKPGQADVQPMVSAVGERAGADQAPGGMAAAQVRSTVTVAAVDPKARIVVLEGPLGNLHKVKAGKDIKLQNVKAGDKFFAVYTEAMAVTVEKAPAAGSAEPTK
jgi:hypothetical protein